MRSVDSSRSGSRWAARCAGSTRGLRPAVRPGPGVRRRGGYANPPEPERAFVLSLLLAHEVELRRLREELAALEDETDCDPRESRARDATGEADE